MYWRLGLDLGTNSIGWWAFRVSKSKEGANGTWSPVESLDGGVYIFPDGREPAKSGRVGDSLAVARRIARGMRRNRDRGNSRFRQLIEELIQLGLLPDDEGKRRKIFQTPKKTTLETDAFNPYRLRAEALTRPLTKYELGRALAHLGKRRGYKSNRKEASEDDGGKLKERIESLTERLGNRTLGQYLWEAFQAECKKEREGGRRRGIRFRAEDEFYPDRDMYASEFTAIREAQSPDHDLSEDDWDRLLTKHILFQWPLKPVERGRCEFFPSEPRHWKDTPIGHDFRIYQELNALRWVDADYVSHALDAEQRRVVLDRLLTYKSEVKFASLRKLKRADGSLLFVKGSTFNLEDDKRKGLKPHRIAALLQAEPLLVPLWESRIENEDTLLDDIFDVLHQSVDDKEALSRLMADFELAEEAAERLTALKLSSGTAHVSRRFMEQVVPVMADQGLLYWEAVSQVTDENGEFLHHSLRDDRRRWANLPYYGEVLSGSLLGANPNADPEREPEKHFGKINNPTVHVALNSLRRVVNTLIERFGAPPVQVHVELTRDLKLPRERRDKINAEQAANQRENERIKKLCAEHGIHDPSARDIKKVKLWEELGKEQFARRCVFSGKTISAQQLFNGEAEIEHILPFSRTLDDSMSNLTVSMRWANRLKGAGTPHEAFSSDSHSDKGILWDEILQRVDGLPKEKRWRFGPDAMQRYEKNGGFIARQLTDTAYMSRVAQRYLGSLEGVEQVVPNPGRLTAMVRGKWGLNGILSDDNRKTRTDHRHHAVDAAVIGLVDRSVLNEISRLTARGADDLVRIGLPKLDDGLRNAIRARVPEIVTAYKPDHGTGGRMFNETAYGFVTPDRRDPALLEHNLVVRKALARLTPKECKAIRDPGIRSAVLDHLYQATGAGMPHANALAEFVKETGIQRVRILVANQTVRPVPSAPYKGYAPESYVCCDVWRIPPSGGNSGEPKWRGVFWPYAETKGGPPDKALKKPHPAARFVTRLFKDDLIAVGEEGSEDVLRVRGFSTTNNKLDVERHNVAEGKQNYVSINVLGRQGLRKLYVAPDGRILRDRQGARR